MSNFADPHSNEEPLAISVQAPAPVDYAANYKELHSVVERLKRGGPGDIEKIVDDFRRGVAAYDACRSRLEAIRIEIDAEISRLSPKAPVEFA
jgi:exonuclease VII small subunit